MSKEYITKQYALIMSEIRTAATTDIRFDRLRDLRKLEEFIQAVHGSEFLNGLRQENGLEAY